MSKINVDTVEPEGATTDLTLGDSGDKVVIPGTIKISGGSPGADKLLTSDADGDATWVAAAAGFDSIALLSSQDASTSASVNFDNTLLTSTYKTYEFKYMNVVGSADGVQLQMKFSDDNGSNFDSNHTGGFLNSYTSSSDAGVTYDASMDSIGADHHMLGTDQSWDAGDSMGGRVTIQNPSSTSFITTYQGEASYITHHGTIYNYTTHIGGIWDSLAAVNYVRFQMASGNLVTGTFQLWGYK